MRDCQENCEYCQNNKDEAFLRFKKGFTVTPTGCWQWSKVPTDGYGRFSYTRGVGRIHYAHQFSYYYHKGHIEEGLEIDHLCRNRACVNPEHLEAVTHKENIRRSPNHPAAVNAAKTHCKWGHSFEGVPRVDNKRICPECYKRRRVAIAKTLSWLN